MEVGGGPVNVGGAVVGPTGIVVAGGVDHGDTGIGESGQLARQHALGGDGQPLVVEEVASDQERVGSLLKGEVHQCAEGFAARLLKPLA